MHFQCLQEFARVLHNPQPFAESSVLVMVLLVETDKWKHQESSHIEHNYYTLHNCPNGLLFGRHSRVRASGNWEKTVLEEHWIESLGEGKEKQELSSKQSTKLPAEHAEHRIGGDSDADGLCFCVCPSGRK